MFAALIGYWDKVFAFMYLSDLSTYPETVFLSRDFKTKLWN